jgi:hypothetical protein
MIDFLKRPLHSMCQPHYDMIGVVRVDLLNEIQPRRYITADTLDAGRPVKIEDPASRPINPTAL